MRGRGREREKNERLLKWRTGLFSGSVSGHTLHQCSYLASVLSWEGYVSRVAYS